MMSFEQRGMRLTRGILASLHGAMSRWVRSIKPRKIIAAPRPPPQYL